MRHPTARCVVAVAAALVLLMGLCQPAQAQTASRRPVITGMSKHSGPAAGGTLVWIHGRHLAHVSKVTFGGIRARIVQQVSRWTVLVRTPRVGYDKWTHAIVYTHHRHSSWRNARASFAFVRPPQVTGLSAHAGPTSGARITVYGHDFRAVRTVLVGGHRASAVHTYSSTRLTATVPAHAPARLDIVVQSAYGRSSLSKADRYTYTAAPKITRMVRTIGPAAGGTWVELNGEHLAGATRVAVDGHLASSYYVRGDYEVDVVMPPHAPGTVDVRVTTAGGTSALTAADRFTYTTANPESWTSHEELDAFRGQMQDISCPTATNCTAIDDTSVADSTAEGWSQPTVIDSGGVLHAVSCPTVDFCVAVGLDGSFIRTTGTWQPAAELAEANLTDVSCPDTGVCFATDYDGVVFELSGGVWSAPVAVTDRPFSSISCAAVDFCLALTRSSGFIWNGSDWRQTAAPSGSGDFTNLSCTAPTFCMAVDIYGRAYLWDGASWNERSSALPMWNTRRISCADPSLCVALGYPNVVSVYRDGTWSDPVAIVPERVTLRAVSCPTAEYCVVVDDDGQTINFDGEGWSPPAATFPTNGAATAISCPSATFCAMSDSDGNTYMFEGGSWSGPTTIMRGIFLDTDVSCVSPTFCLFVSPDHSAAIFDGDSWTPAAPTIAPMDSVSCVSITLCISAGEIFDGAHWRTIEAPAVGRNPQVSCASAIFCAAVGQGKAAIFDGSTWGPAVVVDPSYIGYDGDDRVSCPVEGFCLAIDGDGRASVLHDGKWTIPASIGGNPPTAVSCASATFCEAVDVEGVSRIFDGTRWSDAVRLPDPGNGIHASAQDVSCPSAHTCVAIGQGAVYRTAVG